MTVKELKEQLGSVPDDTVLLVPSLDHSYLLATVDLSTALCAKNGTYTEDHGERLTPHKTYGKRVRALIFS